MADGSINTRSSAVEGSHQRTYARAIAGQPLNMTFEPTSKRFEFCYTPDSAIAAPTEIFASRHYSYAGGMEVTAPCFSCEYFLRTACRLFLSAFLWSACMSRTHGCSALSE